MSVGAGVRKPPRLTAAETRLRLVLLLIALECVGFAAFYVVLGLIGTSEFPFTANSTAKDGLFAMIALIARADIRRFGWLTSLIVGGHAILATVLGVMLISGHTDSVKHTMGGNGGFLGNTGSAVLWMCIDIVIVAVVGWMYAAAGKARYGLKYLGVSQFRVLAAVSEILTDREHEDEPDPEAVAAAVDDYLAGFTAQSKWRIRLGLFVLAWYPVVFSLRPPLWMQSPAERQRYIERLFIDAVDRQRGLAPLRDIRQTVIRTAQQMSFIGFYRDPAVGRRCGYVPFSQLPHYPEAMQRVDRNRPRVTCLGPSDIQGDALDADVVVIGSGAAGATIASHLLDQGKEVVIVERGRHVDPSEFTEDEPTQFSNLYADGALQLSKDFKFQVLQGMCVGGGTVVNNAVCFDIPEEKLDYWVDPRRGGTGLDPSAFREAFRRVRQSLDVTNQDSNPAAMTPVGRPFEEGARLLGHAGEFVECNIADCLGCGYCNIGCAYGKKLSMLDVTLPRAQAKHGKDALRIIAECRVDKIVHSNSVAREVRCTLSDGSALSIRAAEVVVAAGAIASSAILARSGIGGKLVGRELGFNIATPLVCDFDEALHPERGLQISHWLESKDGAFALETWGQPIVSMSLFMPGWFAEHERNMRRYPHMACVGSVVGSESTGVVKPARNPRAVKLEYTPSKADLSKLTEGMKLAGRIMLAAGARRVMPSSLAFHEYNTAAELERLPADVSRPGGLSVNTAHPQGGNRLASDSRNGVVAPDFRVHGMQNVWVCDASVFPTTITVNPQLTVMALATYAAGEMA